MRALIRRRYGGPEALEIQDTDMPDLPEDGVLVRVRAASLNPIDRYELTGTPYVGRVRGGVWKPKDPALGADVAGVVESVGPNATGVQPGDEVFGRTAALGDVAPLKRLARKPAALTFEEAAALPVAGVTALEGLRDKGGLQPGGEVLINGASGGVGTFAVQIAKALGAQVTAVCSTRNVETARALGADRVIDYTTEDFTRADTRFDVFLDIAGSRSWSEAKRVLKSKGRFVLVGASKGGPWLGPLRHFLAVKVSSRRDSRKPSFFMANLSPDNLATLAELAGAGNLKPVIDRSYRFEEVADALRYLGEGHARGKIVLTFS